MCVVELFWESMVSMACDCRGATALRVTLGDFHAGVLSGARHNYCGDAGFQFAASPGKSARERRRQLRNCPRHRITNYLIRHLARALTASVWLARNAIGQWQALKVIYLAIFDNNVGPFDREFNGIS